MRESCRRFREAWPTLVAGETSHALAREAGHAEGCESCRAWSAARARQVAALSSLGRPPAPRALASALERDLAERSDPRRRRDERVARALRALPRRSAPPELAERVAGGEAASFETLVAPLLARVPRPRAPRVLERLVAEELADPAAARARRFPGDLERPATPASLFARARMELLRAARRPRPRSALVGWVAAAVLAVWIGVRLVGGGRSPEPRWSFEVSHAGAGALDPWARGLGSALGGGAAHAVEPIPGGTGREERR